MVHKMRQYIKTFSKAEEKDLEKNNATPSGTARIRCKKQNSNKGSLTGWQIIRNSALGFEMEQIGLQEDEAL